MTVKHIGLNSKTGKTIKITEDLNLHVARVLSFVVVMLLSQKLRGAQSLRKPARIALRMVTPAERTHSEAERRSGGENRFSV